LGGSNWKSRRCKFGGWLVGWLVNWKWEILRTNKAGKENRGLWFLGVVLGVLQLEIFIPFREEL